MRTEGRDCRGCYLDPGVYYCAVHQMWYFSPPKMVPQLRHGKTLHGLQAVQAWLDRRPWPTITLPHRAVLVVVDAADFAGDDDFGSLAEMLRWMDGRHMRNRGDE